MTSKGKRIISVFLETLDEQEQKEVLNVLNEYQKDDRLNKSLFETKTFSEKRILGPLATGNNCPYCGR